jgi:uncharacterized protein YukE
MAQQPPTIDQVIREAHKHMTALSQLLEMIGTELGKTQAENIQLRARVAELDKPKKPEPKK